MALFWKAKAPAAVITYEWEPELAPGDLVEAVTPSATGATIDSYEINAGVVSFVMSGGTVGQTATVSLTATTSNGQTLSERIYLPIVGPGVLAETVLDVVSFALRKVTGLADTPDADQASDALERLQDMLDMWRLTGGDVGAPSPLTLNSVIYCPDGYLMAIKNNLILQLADLYGFDVSGVTVQNARAGLYMIRQANLADERPGVYY